MNNNYKFRITEEKRNILIVEDDIINQEMLKESLAKIYNLNIAQTGEEAIEFIKNNHEILSLVLLDLILPNTKGIDVLKFIKNNKLYMHLPVIVMTSDIEAEEECLTIGAIDFISKPYPASKIIQARIKRIIELSEDRDILKFTERDNLTGLYNRDFFYRYSSQMDLFHKDKKSDCVVVDVNHFHLINERFGKTKGDELLKRIGEVLLNFVKVSGGMVCRDKADTFMIYCPHRDSYNEVLTNISNTINNDDELNHVRIRIGVYSDSDKDVDIERRFDRAKLAADSVRDKLNTPIGYYDNSMSKLELLEEQLIDDFESGISNREFSVYYQPKFNIEEETPKLCSCEALVRWNHSKLGMVSPGIFIPLFEKNGLIQELDYYVWKQVGKDLKEWKNKYNINLPISVNVSRIDLLDLDLPNKLVSILKDNNLSTSDIILEITESAYTNGTDRIISEVERLRQLGFKIEMDDFGSGYSSLSMFTQLPIDVLKLDMHFIKSAFKDKIDTRLLNVMISLAKSFNIPTIAEGVETIDQVNILKDLGCNIIQGYYFSKPITKDEFEKIYLLHEVK